MGQSQATSLKEGFLTCGNRDAEEKILFGPSSKDALNLLEDSLKRCADRGVIDRTDLVTLWPATLSDNFITTNSAEADHYAHIIVPEDGEVKMVTTRHKKDMKKTDVLSLALQTDQMTCFSKDKPYYRVRVYSEEANYLRVSRCKKESEIVDLILEVLQTGVDSIDVTICREVLELEFDKVQLVEEYDSAHPGKKAEDLPKQWLITHFLWATVHEYRLEGEEPLHSYFAKLTQLLSTGKASSAKADLIKEMTERGAYSKLEIERFSEAFAEGTSTHYKTARYLHLNAARAPSRKFEVMRRYDLIPQGKCVEVKDPESSTSAGRRLTIQECAKRMMREVEIARKHRENWQLALAWEPGKFVTVEEHMHKAKRCQMRNNESGLSMTIQHIVEFLNKHGNNARLRSKGSVDPGLKGARAQESMFGSSNIDVDRLPSVKPDHMDLIYSVNKKVVDKLVKNYLEGLVTKEQFSEKLIATCERMITLIDNVVLPVAQHERSYASYTNGLRVKADYLRYLNIYVPSWTGATAQECEKVYADALKMGMSGELKPRHLAAVASCVNYSLFLAEVKRDLVAAAAVCEDAVKTIQGRELYNQPTPSEIFNWQLLRRNMEAFQCWLVLLAVRFDAESVKKQLELLTYLNVDKAKEEEKKKEEERKKKEEEEAKGVLGMRMCASNRQTGQKEKKVDEEKTPHAERSSWYQGETPEMRTVHHWLRGCPLFVQQNSDIKRGRSLGHDDPSLTSFKSVRWIERVEELDPGNLSEEIQEKLHEAGLIGGTQEGSSKLYLLACIAHPRSEQDADPKQGIPNTGFKPGREYVHLWSAKLQEELRKWPIADAKPLEKELRIGKPAERRHFVNQVLTRIDDYGIVESEARIGDNPNVYPGDTIIIPDKLSMSEFKSEESKKLASPGPIETYKFVPCLKTSSSCIIDVVEYIDWHQKFVGFPRGKTLQPGATFDSLDILKKEIAARKHEEMVARREDGAVTRRRIPGLSARRDPKSASERGCK